MGAWMPRSKFFDMALTKCSVCGADISEEATVCPKCGQPQVVKVHCADCDCTYSAQASACPQCGAPNPRRKSNSEDPFANGPSGKSRGMTAVLAILLGAFGVQFFYVGKNTAGIVFLAVTLVTCGSLGVVTSIFSIVQGIILFTKDNAYFESNYIESDKTFPI